MVIKILALVVLYQVGINNNKIETIVKNLKLPLLT